MISITAMILLAGSYSYLLLASGDNDLPASVDTGQPSPADAEVKATTGGSYVDYSDDFIQATSGTKILFFHAPWCPQCRELEADIRARGVPEGVTIAKVDYDSSQRLRQNYGVTLQTTLVKIDDDGNLIAKYIAYDNPDLAAVIANLL